MFRKLAVVKEGTKPLLSGEFLAFQRKFASEEKIVTASLAACAVALFLIGILHDILTGKSEMLGPLLLMAAVIGSIISCLYVVKRGCEIVEFQECFGMHPRELTPEWALARIARTTRALWDARKSEFPRLNKVHTRELTILCREVPPATRRQLNKLSESITLEYQGRWMAEDRTRGARLIRTIINEAADGGFKALLDVAHIIQRYELHCKSEDAEDMIGYLKNEWRSAVQERR